MAIDTRNRRASAICPALVFRAWPAPDGNLATVADREHMAYLYRLAPEGGGHSGAKQHRRGVKYGMPRTKPIEDDEDILLALLSIG